MNRTDMVMAINERTGIKKGDIEKTLQAVPYVMRQTLNQGGTVTWVGMGKFAYVFKAARKGRNVRTGQAVDIPARWDVKYKAANTPRGILRD